ncbi:MAG: type II CRISPR-associated endonuclease Cas1 [Lachnospiraceae bacterium]|nr:type II CRISPR-associated endonuclease Cas1 [Lachnospiraceae bacterium]
MSWRIVVISNRAKLDLNLNYMVVRNEVTTKIHLSEISILLLESTGISLTTSLMSELAKRKIKVIICDEKRNPIAETVPYYGSHDTSAKIRQQIVWDENIKGQVWTEIVSEKIRKQAGVLEKLNREEASLLRGYISEIQYRDSTNREGHAAKVYFNALFGMDFTRTEEIPINAALNYGYSIFLSAVNRDIVSNGYITQLGVFHNNMFNPFNFASDLMEPFRPVVDMCVYQMGPVQFEHEEKMELVALLNSEVMIDGKKQFLNNAIKIYCRSVFEAINERDVSLIRFCKDEL